MICIREEPLQIWISAYLREFAFSHEKVRNNFDYFQQSGSALEEGVRGKFGRERYCEHGDLYNHLKKIRGRQLPEAKIIEWGIQVLQVIFTS